MSEHIHTFTELDKQIQDGFNRFRENHTPLFRGIREAYVQGFLDGIRSNLNDLVEAYKRDINNETNKQ